MRPALALLATALAGTAVAVSCAPSSNINTSGGAGGGNGGSTDTGIFLDGGTDATCAGATTCAKAGVECGPIGDGCGGILQCGDCTGGLTCGGGTTAGKCGTTPCKPKSCTQLGANCGPVGDGCGGTLQCGTCPNGETCGGGGTSSVCGSGSMCTAKDCAQQAVNCGPVADGCGGLVQCGSCPSNQSCGGGGISSVCGAPVCPPKTCGANDCGPIGDGCGGILHCGACGLPTTCGGAGTASQCGVPASCTGLCLKQTTCPTAGTTTSISGTVYAPNGVDPLPNALVYVPNAAVKAFTAGVTCDNCGAPASGSPLVSTVTAVDGTFTLGNMPVGTDIPLVIQLGRWRRQVKIPSVGKCTDTPVDADSTRMPRNQGEGDIPLMAFSTGAVDALECVMRKIGIDDTEFTAPSGGGRVHLYEGLTDHNSQNATSGVWASGGAKAVGSPTEDQLWSTQAALSQYDLVFFPCQADQASPSLRSAAAHQNLVDYVNAGGRVFATHFSYIWLYQTSPFSDTALWHVEQHPSPADQKGYVNMNFPKGQLLAEWLALPAVGASSTLGEIDLQVIRHDHDDVVAPSQAWITINDTTFPGAIVDYTFNTPVGKTPDKQCGRVLFDDFHVENTKFSSTVGAIFPTECLPGDMTPQEKLLEFMIFDLASCVTPDNPPPCQTKTCTQLGVHCGPAGDGCGGQQDCGSCPTGQTCGGGGTPSQCGAPQCTPKTCQDQHIECGPAGDGCGKQILCGSCPTGQSCGGGGMPGVCGSQKCTPRSCSDQGITCGPAGDGCGGLLACGNCTPPQTCGGGGTPGVCGTQKCTPKTCVELGANCGPVGDGCGGLLMCGDCTPPQTCGGGGTPSVCGGSGPI